MSKECTNAASTTAPSIIFGKLYVRAPGGSWTVSNQSMIIDSQLN